jgi:hypothetical protein
MYSFFTTDIFINIKILITMSYYYSEYPKSVDSLNGKRNAVLIEPIDDSIIVDNSVEGRIRLKSTVTDPGGDGFVMKESDITQHINSDISLGIGNKLFYNEQVEVGTENVALCLNHRIVDGWNTKHIDVNLKDNDGEPLPAEEVCYMSDIQGAGLNSVEIGVDAQASMEQSIAIGKSASATGGRFAVAVGGNSIASATRSSAFGDKAIAQSSYATAIGSESKALGMFSTALGEMSRVQTGTMCSTAIGYEADASTDNTVEIGRAADNVHIPGSLNGVKISVNSNGITFTYADDTSKSVAWMWMGGN